jgi:hypothetical protein
MEARRTLSCTIVCRLFCLFLALFWQQESTRIYSLKHAGNWVGRIRDIENTCKAVWVSRPPYGQGSSGSKGQLIFQVADHLLLFLCSTIVFAPVEGKLAEKSAPAARSLENAPSLCRAARGNILSSRQHAREERCAKNRFWLHISSPIVVGCCSVACFRAPAFFIKHIPFSLPASPPHVILARSCLSVASGRSGSLGCCWQRPPILPRGFPC